MSDKKPNPIDRHVGNKIRMRRNMLNLSQEKLGEKIGVTFQQIQKYERGLNRVGASRLKSIADVLTVDVAFFFSDRNAQNSGATGFAEDSVRDEDPYLEFCSSMEGIQLITAFSAIGEPGLRRKILDVIKAMSELYTDTHKAKKSTSAKSTPKIVTSEY